MTALYIVNPDEPLSLQKALLIALIGIAVVLIELGLLSVIIRIISSLVRLISKKSAAPAAPPAVPAPAAAPASGGSLRLENVDEPTAAVVMALVSHQSGIPLERLKFRSIKLVQEKEEEK